MEGILRRFHRRVYSTEMICKFKNGDFDVAGEDILNLKNSISKHV